MQHRRRLLGAERLYRERLQQVTIADILRQVAANGDPERGAKFAAWLKTAR